MSLASALARSKGSLDEGRSVQFGELPGFDCSTSWSPSKRCGRYRRRLGRGLERGTEWTYLQMRFGQQENKLQGACDAFVLPFDFVQGRKVIGIRLDGSRVQFEAS